MSTPRPRSSTVSLKWASRWRAVTGHGRAAVPERIDDEVRDDAVEGRRIRVHLEIARHPDVNVAGATTRHHPNEALDPATNSEAGTVDSYGARIEPAEIEELIDQVSRSAALLEKSLTRALPPGRQEDRRGAWSVVMMPCITPKGARSSCAARAMNWPFRSHRRWVRSWSSAPSSSTPPSVPSARRRSVLVRIESRAVVRLGQQDAERPASPLATSGTARGARRVTGGGGSAAVAARRCRGAPTRERANHRRRATAARRARRLLADPTGTSSPVCGRKRRHAARPPTSSSAVSQMASSTPTGAGHATGASLGQRRERPRPAGCRLRCVR